MPLPAMNFMFMNIHSSIGKWDNAVGFSNILLRICGYPLREKKLNFRTMEIANYQNKREQLYSHSRFVSWPPIWFELKQKVRVQILFGLQLWIEIAKIGKRLHCHMAWKNVTLLVLITTKHHHRRPRCYCASSKQTIHK